MSFWVADLFSPEFLNLLGPLSLIFIGLISEKYYISRVAILSNAIALATFFYTFTILPIWLIYYINVLTILGLISLVSYLFKVSLPSEFYLIAGIASSIVSGIVLLWGATL